MIKNPLHQALTATLVSSALLLSSCASIINGSNQKVAINSLPAGANVKVDGAPVGVTPMEAQLARKSAHQIEINKTGYKPYQIVLDPAFNGLPILNVLIGGIIGIIVDMGTGAGNTLTPKSVMAPLEKN